MTKEELLNLAFVNFDTLEFPVRGVEINCHGLNDMSNFRSSPRPASDLGKRGIVYVFPYYSAWAWCNDHTVAFMDSILDAVWELLSLGENIPLVITGGSMGGMTSLIYSIRGSRKPVAVGCLCPVTDMARYASGGGEGTRSVYTAVMEKGVPIERSIEKIDPMKHIGEFHRVPYLIVGGEKDYGISIELYQRPFCEKMKAAGYDVTLLCVPGMGHCEIAAFEDAYQTYLNFICGAIENAGIVL